MVGRVTFCLAPSLNRWRVITRAGNARRSETRNSWLVGATVSIGKEQSMKTSNYLRALITLSVVLAAAAPLLVAGDFVYAQTTEPQSYSGFPGIPINGLTINLPAASKYFNVAVVTVNLPNLVVTNCTSNSATITLVGDSPAGVVFGYATVGCDTAVATSGPKPVTIVLRVRLGSTPGAAFPDWAPGSGSTISTSTFASISALLVKE